jgi:hypothetical protein
MIAADERSVTANQFPLLFLELSVQCFPCQGSEFHFLLIKVLVAPSIVAGLKYRPDPPQVRILLDLLHLFGVRELRHSNDITFML